MANFSRTDLDFVLQQILLAESDSNQQRNGNLNALPGLVGSPVLRDGLRYVDGSYNNLEPGQKFFGAADQIFPRLLTPDFRDAEAGTSYAQFNGTVIDSQPRTISNFIVDQTPNNPAAEAAFNQTPGAELVNGTRMDNTDFTTYFIPNVTPDEGLSAPFNSWFTLFGQFFDHGLDLVNKGNSGTVFVPLQPDDPLYDDTPGAPNFMTVTRATNQGGQHEHVNQTTPFVDQNQTYTSHSSHQVFLREYALNGGDPVSTGKLLEGGNGAGGLANWAEVKAQARDFLGINLTDADVTNLPLLATDSYGQFIPGPNGLPQLVLSGNSLLEGNLANPVNIPGNVVRTGHAFLDDIAHNAAPRDAAGAMKTADGDNFVNPGPAAPGEYDDELLDAHFITGDGRGNENIGLTTVHTIFHAEHNRKVDEIKDLINASEPAFQAQWHINGNVAGPWDGERLFQAARFATEMQYQHLVFEEFARKIQPNLNPFVDYDSSIDPAIMAEFAHVVYRFGHSMLTETVARTKDGGANDDIGLIQAFLNPTEFADGYANNIDAAEAVVRGMTKQVGNEIDEFVTEALRNNLVGLPLDLAAINMARGRDTGIPSLNEARRMFFDDTNDSALSPYTSWADFGASLRHPESLTNFIAVYGNHPSIAAATTMTEKRDAADALISGTDADSTNFMNSDGTYTPANTGLNDVDFWVGGLAEQQAPFGGLLGSTFNFVFESQLQKLQDADRFYYLGRTAGLDFFTQLEENSFAEMIMRNLPDVKHLPFDVFSTPTYIFELADLGTSGQILNPDNTPYNETNLLIRDNSLGAGTVRYNGGEHIVMGGTDNNDRMRAGIGDDTLWGDGGNDRLEGGGGNDSINGGDGNDIITDSSGDENIKGGAGDDFINGGGGINLILAGEGNDFVVTGANSSEVFAGPGNDFIFGSTANAAMIGNDGHDWIQYGTAGGAVGDNNDPFNGSLIRGNDVFVGGGGGDDFTGEGGDDIMNGMGGVDRSDGDVGFDWTVSDGQNTAADIDLDRLIVEADLPGADLTVDRFKFVEGASGWNLNDTIRGDDATFTELTLVDPLSGQNNALDNVNAIRNSANQIIGHSAADRIAQINGLSGLLGGATVFDSGNILLGGGGSDIIEGRGGDDIIDGDAWLNTRIVALNTSNNPISFDNMTATLRSGMQNGTYKNPEIVREILTTNSGTDTAVYQDVFANYILTFSSNGTLFITHNLPVGGGGGLTDEGTDTVRNIERLQFADRTAVIGTSGDDNLVGTANNDTLYGLAGNDRLDGQGGVDQLIGGTGNDTYVVDTTTDTITELTGVAAGNDTVESSVTFTIGVAALNNIENITLTGANAINATGNAVANILTGNDNNNVLTGAGGADTLVGNGGNDTLAGGAGIDNMTGGDGDDIYIIDSLSDSLTELPGGGTDTVRSSLTYTLANGSNLENLELTGTTAINGTGNTDNNAITGNNGNNALSGGDGDDTLVGLLGADVLTGGAGADTFSYSLVTQSTPGVAGRDSIADFVSGTDKINLNAIDANAGVAGNQDFQFIGGAAFSAPGPMVPISKSI
ncbi:MAG: heme peroxidase [Nitrosomonas sp. PRO4]|nr:heme peroxidase [Nitrosomonas sp. PRO4]